MAKKVQKATTIKMKCSKCGSTVYHTLVKESTYRCNVCGNYFEKKK